MTLKIGWRDIVVREVNGVREVVQVFPKDESTHPKNRRDLEDVTRFIPDDKVAATIIYTDGGSTGLRGGMEDDLELMIILNRKDLVEATEEEIDYFLSILLVNEYFHYGNEDILKEYKEKMGYDK